MNHQPPTPPSRDGSPDPLLLRYAEANALDDARPGPALRENVLAHARTQAAVHAKAGVANAAPPLVNRQQSAANDSAWKWRALGSVAVLGLVGLLVLQFDRGTPEDRELALGRSSPSTSQAPVTQAPTPQPADSSPAPAPTSVPATGPAPSDQPAKPSRSTPVVPSEPPTSAPKAPKTERVAETDSGAQAMARPTAPGSLADEADARPQAAAPTPFPASPAAPRAAANESVSAPPALEAAAPQAEPPSSAATAAAPSVGQVKRLDRPAPAVSTRSRSAAPDLQKSEAREEPAEQPGAATPMPNPDRALLAAAVRRDALQAVRDALVQGAQVNAARPDGRTALMLAAERGDAALIQLLLDAGADTQRLDREGLSAADWARRSGQTHVLPLLQSLPGR
jgi:hypothetical protein